MKSLSDFKPYEVMYVDGMNLLTRSYFGMSELEYQGKKTGMLYGVARLFLDWKRKAPGIEIVMLWEGRNSWRRAKYPIYKAHRGEERSPEESKEFFDCIERVKYALPSMGIRQGWLDTYEADDIVVALAKEEKRKALYSSGDWDWWGLVEYGDILYQHKDVLTREEMGAKFSKKFNVPPIPFHRLWLFKVLTGDSSDNVSGVPRFPKRLASVLCNLPGEQLPLLEGSIIGALQRMGEPKWAAKVKENYWIIERNVELIRESRIDSGDIEWIDGEYSKEALGDVLQKSGMDSLYERLLREG